MIRIEGIPIVGARLAASAPKIKATKTRAAVAAAGSEAPPAVRAASTQSR